MDAIGPMAASVLEPGEEPLNPSVFSLKAFTTSSYRDKPANCRSLSGEAGYGATPGVSHASGGEQTPSRLRESSYDTVPAVEILTSQAEEKEQLSGIQTSSSVSALLSPASPTSAPISPTQRLIQRLSPLGLFGRGRAAEDEGDGTVSLPPDGQASQQRKTCESASNTTARSTPASGDAEQQQASPLSRLFFFSSSTPFNGSLFGSGSVPDPASPGVRQDPVPPLCLVVCIHGLAGAGSDFRYMAERLKQSSLVKVLVSNANTGKTFDGVRKGGERLAEEVRRDVRRHPSLRYICFIGFSLGGLYMRYAVRLLYSPPSAASPATVCGLVPLCLGTVASPHLGVRRFSYVPLPEGFVRPLISSYLRITSRLRGERKTTARGLVKKSGSSGFRSFSSGPLHRADSAASLRSLASEAKGDAEERDWEMREPDPGPAELSRRRAEETRRSNGCVSPSAAQQAYAQAAAEFISGGDSEVAGSEAEHMGEDETSSGPNLGRLSQLYESTTLADLMLLSASEQERASDLQAEKRRKIPFWSWASSQPHKDAGDAEPGATEKSGERSEDGSHRQRVGGGDEDEDDEPLLVQMSKGVFVESLQAFKHRRLYANARGDVLVPLGTAAIEPALPANPQLQLILQQARRSMIAGSGRIVMIVQPDGTPIPMAGNSPTSPTAPVLPTCGSGATAAQDASPFFSCQSSFAGEFSSAGEATALSSLALSPSVQLPRPALSSERSTSLGESCAVDLALSPGASTCRGSGSPTPFHQPSLSDSGDSSREGNRAEAVFQKDSCSSVFESQLGQSSSTKQGEEAVLPPDAAGEEEESELEKMDLSEDITHSESLPDDSLVNDKTQTFSLLTVSSSVSTADPMSSSCSEDGGKERTTVVESREVSSSPSGGGVTQESFLEKRLLPSGSSGGWTDWLKLNTYGDVEAAMAARLNEVRWTKFIVDFPNFIPVAHDSINASGKSRFRTWVTSAGRPIVEQMVDWFIFSLHEALQQENLGLELSETAKAG